MKFEFGSLGRSACAAGLVFGLSFAVPAATPPTPLAQCERWIASAPYASREGLLQMFLQAARTDGITSAHLDATTLRALDGKLKTLFPLKETESVAYADSVLTLRFTGPVHVKVPGTWRQADLALSREVRFRVRPLPDGGPGMEFEVLQGSVDLTFGWLARKVSSLPAKLQGKTLRYWSVDAHKVSGISLEQETRYAPGAFRLESTPSILRIQVPGLAPIAFSDSTAEYMGIQLAWRGDSLRTPEGKWVLDSAGVRQFRSLRDQMRSTLDSAQGKPSLVITEALSYQLEERKGSLSKGFRFGK